MSEMSTKSLTPVGLIIDGPILKSKAFVCALWGIQF